MENMLTSYLLSKSIADSHNLEDKNEFIVQSIIIDQALDNQALSTVFKIVQAKNSPVQKAEEAETITITVEETPRSADGASDDSNSETTTDEKDCAQDAEDTKSQEEDNEEGAEATKDENTTDESDGGDKDDVSKNDNESLKELTGSIEEMKAVMKGDVMAQFKTIEGFIEEAKTQFNSSNLVSLKNEKINTFFNDNNINLNDYNKLMTIDRIDEIISKVKDKKFKESLSKIEGSKASSKAKLKSRAKAIKPLLDETTLENFKKIFEEHNVDYQDQVKLSVSVLYPVQDLIREIEDLQLVSDSPKDR